LWVDDELDASSSPVNLLRLSGFAVDLAATGTEAIRLAKQRQYDGVLLDLRLPDTTGLELLSRLRAEVGAFVPVAVLTGYATVPSVVQAMRLGAVEFLEKPLFGDALLTAARRLVVGTTDQRDTHLSLVCRLISVSPRRSIPSLLATSLLEDVEGWTLTFLAATREGRALACPAESLVQSLNKGLSEAKALPCLAKETLSALERGGDRAVRAVRLSYGLSERAFRRETAAALRYSWSQVMARVRVRHCLRRLRDEEEHVRQIAFDAGYSHPSELNRECQRLLGVTPSNFRILARQAPQRSLTCTPIT